MYYFCNALAKRAFSSAGSEHSDLQIGSGRSRLRKTPKNKGRLAQLVQSIPIYKSEVVGVG